MNKRRVLVIEDNPDGRGSLRVILKTLGHEVEVAADGEEGVRKGLTQHPEVVLVDIGLPGLSGFEVARRLRAVLGRGVLLIAHTGYGQPEDVKRGEEAGFDAYLVKPADLQELSSLVDRGPDAGE
jgi:DNA-binding response OmpR family regulator